MTHLLLRLAVGRGEAGARAAAVGLAAVVEAASSNASNSSQTELRTLHAQLRTLARLCAPLPPIPPPIPPPAGVPMAAIAEPPPAAPRLPRRLSLPSSRPPEASDAGELASTSTSIPLRAGEYPTTSTDRAARVGGGGGGADEGSRLDAIRAAAAARRPDNGGYVEAEPATSADERARRITASLVADLDLALAASDDGMGASTSQDGGSLRARGSLDELVEREFEEVARAAAAAARSRNDALAAAVGLDLDDDDESDLDEESEFAAVVAAQHRAAAAAAAASAGERGRARLGRSGLGAGGGIQPTQQPPATDPDVCTFVSSGSSFMEQHWYFCYTCDLTVSKGCCGACAKACHVGHKVVYSRRSRFFCDCGAGSVPGHECQCLMPSSDPASTSNSRSGIDRADAGNLEDRGADADNLKSAKPRGYRPVTEDSDSEADDDDPNCRGDVDETDDEDESVAPLTSEPGAAKAVAALRDSLLGSGLAASLVALCDRVVDHLRANPPWELPARRGMEQSVALLSLPPPFELAPLPPPPRLLIPDRTTVAATTRHDLVHLRRGFKAGSFEVRPRPEHAAPRELLPAIVMGTLRRSALSCARGSGFLAVAEGDKVCVLDAGALAGVGGAGSIVPVPGSASSASSSEQRVGIRPLSRSGVKFEVSRVLFNPAADEYLAVAGYAQCHVFTLGPKGEIADRLCVGPEEWPLDGMHGALLDVDWVPGRTGALSITVSAHVAVFDLAKSSVAPVLTVSLPPRESDGAPARIVASAFAPRGGENRLLVLSEDGALFSHPVRDGDEGDATIDESCRLALPEVCRGRAGLSVHFSRAHGVALASFDGGVTVLARLHPETGAVVASCVVREDSGSNPDGDRNDEPPEASSPFGPAGFSHWSEACAPPPPPWPARRRRPSSRRRRCLSPRPRGTTAPRWSSPSAAMHPPRSRYDRTRTPPLRRPGLIKRGAAWRPPPRRSRASSPISRPCWATRGTNRSISTWRFCSL